MNTLIERPEIEQGVSVVACPHPFKVEQAFLTVEAGMTVAELMETVQPRPELRMHAHVAIMDTYIPRDMWPLVRPEPGAMVTIRMVPTGGGGGGKNPLRTLLQIAVIAASFALPGAILGAELAASTLFGSLTFGQALGGFIAIAGNLLVNAIAPPSTPRLQELSGSSVRDSSTLSITGARNQVNLFGVVPRVLGRHRIFPPFAAQQVTEIIGDDQFLRGVVTLGPGPLTITDIKIGETDIANFDDVELEIREGLPGDAALTLYPNDIFQDNLSVLLQEVDAGTIRTTKIDADEISVDISFLQGLVKFVGGGQKQDVSVDVLVEYRTTSPQGSWVTAGTISTTARKNALVRAGLRWNVARDQYDVRLHRETADDNDSSVFDDVTWTALRTITNEDPLPVAELASIAFRIKATDQLNGVIDQLNCIAESRVKDWNGSTWVEQATQNNASLFRDVLQGKGNARPLADSRIHLESLQEWHDFCVTNGFKFNMVVDFETTVEEMLADIASAGRASPALIDGKRGVVIDKAQTTPVQHFSPRNSWGYKGNKVFKKIPHAWRVRFVNEDAGFINDERIVYFDGFDENMATDFEGLEFVGVTDPAAIFKHGKYNEAVVKLRPETHSFSADVEQLVCRRGDLIQFNHDVPLFGAGSPRIKTVSLDGSGNMTGVTLDEALTMDVDTNYAMRFRTPTDGSLLENLVSAPGEFTSFTFSTPIPAANPQPAVGDLALFGVMGEESVQMIVKSIRPGEELSAELTCVDAAPAVHTADQVTIPTFDSQITPPVAITQPVVINVRSDSTVVFRNPDGTPEVRILVSLGLINLLKLDSLEGLEARFRECGSAGPWSWLSLQPNDSRFVSFLGVEEGETYDLNMRYRYKNGDLSPWTEVLGHQVTGIINNARNEKILGWPGTLVDCHVNPANNLVSDGNAAISSLPATISLLADSIRDIVASKSPITYKTPIIDLGGDVVVTPRMSVTADDGTVTNTMQIGTSADGAPVGSFVPLGLTTARYFILQTSVAAGAVPARITEFLTNLDTLTHEERYELINIATEGGVFFERIAAGHFKIETKGGISAFSVARVDAFIGAGGGFTADVISLNTTLTARSVLAAEIKVYDSTDTLADATVAITLIGAPV